MTSLLTNQDSLDPAAKAQILRLLGELEDARDEMQAVERERRRRHLTAGSSFRDLNERYERATQRYDAAGFALDLGLGKHPNEAATQTLTAIREEFCREHRADAPNPRPTNVIPFPRPARGFEPSEKQRERDYLTPKEFATALGISGGTAYKLLDQRGADIGATKTSDGRMSHWRIPLDAPDRLKQLLSRRKD